MKPEQWDRPVKLPIGNKLTEVDVCPVCDRYKIATDEVHPLCREKRDQP